MSLQERYLISADLGTVPSLSTHVLVIGSGVAGYSAALSASAEQDVILITKRTFCASNTYKAQGGVAVALGADDSPQLHLEDTINAGAGLCDIEAVEVLVNEGIQRCRDMIEWGTSFDQVNGEIAVTMEAAHSTRRVIHGAGDATGALMADSLLKRCQESHKLRLLENYFVIDLLHHDGICYGALVLDTTYGRILRINAAATVIATGGAGQIFRETTNPDVATGDGYSLCFRAGAVLRDMEFVQFHPTTLYIAGAPRFLISESVRGEGAHLLNLAGERFMNRYSPDGELASRDVVSQSVFREINSTGTTHVCLDLRHMPKERIERRFPTILSLCADYGLDLTADLIPVRPAAHYMMGGVRTDLHGATTVARLYAAGEVASTGVHGGNRLASNSLLEGLVFGHRAGLAAAATPTGAPFPLEGVARRLSARAVQLDLGDIVRSLKALAWRDLGVYRDAGSLAEAESTIRQWETYILSEQFQMLTGFEIQNMLTVSKIMVRCAADRTESRGAHQRSDFPEQDPSWARHSELSIKDF